MSTIQYVLIIALLSWPAGIRDEPTLVDEMPAEVCFFASSSLYTDDGALASTHSLLFGLAPLLGRGLQRSFRRGVFPERRRVHITATFHNRAAFLADYGGNEYRHGNCRCNSGKVRGAARLAIVCLPPSRTCDGRH